LLAGKLFYLLDFEIEFIKGVNNSLPDFLTREFLQGKSDTNLPLQEEL